MILTVKMNGNTDNHVNGKDFRHEKIVILDAGAQYGKVDVAHFLKKKLMSSYFLTAST